MVAIAIQQGMLSSQSFNSDESPLWKTNECIRDALKKKGYNLGISPNIGGGSSRLPLAQINLYIIWDEV